MNFKKNITITTPIFYANGPLHLGHAYTGVFSDAIKRILTMYGHNVYLAFGADEHGEKIYKTAKNNNVEIHSFIDAMYQKTLSLWKQIDVKHDGFVRTTSKDHKKTALFVFHQLKAKAIIYLNEYSGHYCVSCEQYLQQNDLLDDKYCIFCKKSVVLKKEKCYFLNVRKFAQWWNEYVDHNLEVFQPNFVISEIKNNFVNNNLVDLAITRENLPWGIPISDKQNDTLYVWFDALLSYLTNVKFDANKNSTFFNNFWDNASIIQIIGKEITRFHCFYWPIILHVLGLKLPDRILTHAWVINKQDKMSKSKNNFVYCEDLLKNVSVDHLRYYVIKTFPYLNDCNFSYEALLQEYNNDLVNDFSNFSARVLNMIKLYCNAKVPKYDENWIDEAFPELFNELVVLKNTLYNCVQELDLQDYLNQLFLILSKCNKLINDYEPWKKVKENDQHVAYFLGFMFDVINYVSVFLSPILTKELTIFYKNIFEKPISINNLKINNFQNLSIKNKNFALYQRTKEMDWKN